MCYTMKEPGKYWLESFLLDFLDIKSYTCFKFLVYFSGEMGRKKKQFEKIW